MVVFGTRPEAIKMAPVVAALKASEAFVPVVVASAQHREMMDQVLSTFHIVPDYDLDIMKVGQTLADVTARVLSRLTEVLEDGKPDMVLVHGDTTTSFAAALAAFYMQIPVGHVEAGLRTWEKYSPFPEELNRQLVDSLASLYFAPTELSAENLRRENHPDAAIFVTGNTAIDALHLTMAGGAVSEFASLDKRTIVLTMHRRENWGDPMRHVFRAINRLLSEFPDVEVIFPIHKNPLVRALADEELLPSPRLKRIEPLDVRDFHQLMMASTFVMADSGGIQEEAPSLGKPVLVLRETTERPEGVSAGTLKLVGTAENAVYEAARELLVNADAYAQMAQAKNPYGDGTASAQILLALSAYFARQK
ncbi:MAG: UDP-N-acetylglucosamine 2-epimerase (non-hydrolyzing) [Streptococcaceae bacterium]|jgi:UDP-N-acetylglucosamine 2-epimerase (non-hydrolysing)|nr:UDP-N-acetylglucosamine 2-epimerase (non-hydrolyzing) [Streptococcaceae bacterium]